VLLGKSSSGSGSPSEFTLGNGLSFSGTTLNTTGTYVGPTYQLFTSSDTWTKPTGITFVYVRVVGSGGGGWGGGLLYAGQGGSGGLCVENVVNGTSLSSTVSVTIGAAGTGGAGSSVNNQGDPGGNGGYSSFGNYLFAGGGVGSVAAYLQDTTYYHGVNETSKYLYYQIFNGSSGVGGAVSDVNGGGGNGSTGPGGGAEAGYRGGVGFALKVVSPTVNAQTGNTSNLGTPGGASSYNVLTGIAGTNATGTGYGGGGGGLLQTSLNGGTAGAGGNGYLGGGGGGGAYISQFGGATGGSGGNGGNGGTGFVEVFAW